MDADEGKAGRRWEDCLTCTQHVPLPALERNDLLQRPGSCCFSASVAATPWPWSCLCVVPSFPMSAWDSSFPPSNRDSSSRQRSGTSVVHTGLRSCPSGKEQGRVPASCDCFYTFVWLNINP